MSESVQPSGNRVLTPPEEFDLRVPFISTEALRTPLLSTSTPPTITTSPELVECPPLAAPIRYIT